MPPEAIEKVEALKSQLADAVTTVLAGVPDHLRALIPTNLGPADQIALTCHGTFIQL